MDTYVSAKTSKPCTIHINIYRTVIIWDLEKWNKDGGLVITKILFL